MSNDQIDPRAKPSQEQAADNPSLRHPAHIDDPTTRQDVADEQPDGPEAGDVGERREPVGDEDGQDTTDQSDSDIVDKVTQP